MQIYTVEEIAGFWQVQPDVVQAHVSAGRLRGFNIGIGELELRFHEEDIAKCLETLRSGNGTEPSVASAIQARPQLPGVYRLNMKSAAAEGIDPGAFCLREGIAGVGWPVTTDNPLDWLGYQQLATTKYPNGSWQPVITLHDIPHHSAIWTRHGYGHNTRFYLGLIVGPWMYRNDAQAQMADIRNVRPVIWYEVGGYDAVPISIKNAFTPLTCAAIKQPGALAFTEKLAGQLVSDGVWEAI